jgi:hypothetical protein
MGVIPSRYPPPVDPATEFIGAPSDPASERIEVGVAIVGAGPAGLACASHLAHLLVQDGVVRGVRSGDKGRGRSDERLGNFEPGSDVIARITVLADGVWGHLTGAAISAFGLGGDPQVWSLGVKEIWEVPKPLRRVIHTLGWPLRTAARYREFGGSWIYPMGEDRVSIGFVVGLDYADLTLSSTTSCSSSSCIHAYGAFLKGAGVSPGAPRRSPRAATGRCHSSRRPGCSSAATRAAWSTYLS